MNNSFLIEPRYTVFTELKILEIRNTKSSDYSGLEIITVASAYNFPFSYCEWELAKQLLSWYEWVLPPFPLIFTCHLHQGSLLLGQICIEEHYKRRGRLETYSSGKCTFGKGCTGVWAKWWQIKAGKDYSISHHHCNYRQEGVIQEDWLYSQLAPGIKETQEQNKEHLLEMASHQESSALPLPSQTSWHQSDAPIIHDCNWVNVPFFTIRLYFWRQEMNFLHLYILKAASKVYIPTMLLLNK